MKKKLDESCRKQVAGKKTKEEKGKRNQAA